jgi:DNA helicase II / ATP-dependent DNA helicase PcrA
VTDLHDDEPLDAEQRAAVEATDKAIAVLAGPGSGKTRTLSHRARHLLAHDPGSRALLVTFTNKAAAEMKTRALRFGNLDVDRIEAGTFHHFGLSLLRSNHGKLVGISPDVDIIDAEEAKQFAAEVAAAAGLTDLHDEWSECRLSGDEASAAVAAFGEALEAAKREQNVVDFDDLVVCAAQLLEDHPEVAELYGMRYAHVLVDEFQDTNPAHFAIVRALCPYVKTVSVFADDDQAIMGFAGADAENIERFIEELGARELPLTTNYRCPAAIVQHANLLIAANPDHSGRRMKGDCDGGRVDLRRFPSTAAEAAAIADEIAAMVLRDEAAVPAASIALLVRNGPRATLLVDALRRRKVPVTDWRGAAYDTADRRVFRNCMSVLRPRLSGWQAVRLAELLDTKPGDERNTHAFLEAHPATRSPTRSSRCATWPSRARRRRSSPSRPAWRSSPTTRRSACARRRSSRRWPTSSATTRASPSTTCSASWR